MRLRNVLLLGVIVRVAIAPFFAHPFDVYSWYTIGEIVVSGKQPLAEKARTKVPAIQIL